MISTSPSSLVDQVRKYLEDGGCKEIFIEVTPVPASRPRVSRWGTYYGKTYETFRTQVKEQLRAHIGEPITGQIEALIEIISPRPKTSKRAHPRGDVDNFAKGPLDSMTHAGTFWNDDDQITGLAVFKRFAEQDEPVGIRIIYMEKA